MKLRSLLPLAIGVFLGCSGTSSSSPPSAGAPPGDAGLTGDAATLGGDVPDAGFVPAPHVAFPQLTLSGGTVLDAPQIVSVSFAGDTPHVHAFADWVVGSSWLQTVGRDYGVKGATHLASVTLQQSVGAQVSGDEVEAALVAAMKDGGPLPAPTAQTLYLVEYPAGTRVGFFGGGLDSCATRYDGTAIGGYHYDAQGGAAKFVYAVVPHCERETDDELWVAASHEFIEAATDPFPNTGYGVADPFDAWSFTSGEVADLCNGLWTTEAGHTVQRIFSNSAAAAGRSPCVPLASGPYYGVSAPRDGASVAVGASTDVTLQAWSSEPTDAWILQAIPIAGQGSGSFEPAAHLGTTRVNNGDVATLTVGVPKSAAAGDWGLVWVFSYRSLATAGTEFSAWPVVVFAK